MKSDDPESSSRDDSLQESPASIAKTTSEQTIPPPIEDDSLPQPTISPSSSASTENSSSANNTEISPIGHATIKFSDLVNDNLIAARYISTATIGLLAAYGIAHTPLFFRYRTVSELPSSLFRSRKRIRCRLVKSLVSDVPCQTTTTATTSSSSSSTSKNHPILLQVRHLSPFESLFMSKTWYDRWMRWHPASAVVKSTSRRHDEHEQELLTIQIAGIEAPPPFYYNAAAVVAGSGKPGEWLERLVTDRTRVTCQLLARRVCTVDDHEKGTFRSNNSSSSSSNGATHNILSGNKIKKRTLQEIQHTNNNNFARSSDWDTDLLTATNDNRMSSSSSSSFSTPRNEIAIVKLYYRPKPFQLFATDIGQSMVRFGRAATSENSGLYLKQGPNDRIVDASDAVRDLQKDAAYLDQLSRAEYEAASGSYGMWGDATIRASRPAVVEEVEFQTNASWWRKVWRWLRGG